MTIILDAMGSDKYPDPEILGAIEAVKILNEPIILVGNEEIIRPKLEQLSPGNSLISIVHAPEVVEMWDKRWNLHVPSPIIPWLSVCN